MKKYILFLLWTSVHSLFSQTTSSFIFHSEILNEDRNIRIHLPKSFDSDDDVQYPLILALDGEYLFYSIMGTGEVLTMREIIPESIIVGIDQNYMAREPYSARWIDCSYDYNTGKPDKDGLQFKAFIDNELVPFLEKKYKAGKFKTMAGHSYTANYINYFLDSSVFSGFIAVSPYIPASLEESVAQSIIKADKNIYYFLCTGDGDLSGHISQIKKQDSVLFSPSKNSRFHYAFKDYDGESHMSLTVRSISDALSLVYSDFAPVYTQHMDSVLIREKHLTSWLIQRYENMKVIYGISIPYREDDITSVAWIIEEQEDWDELQKIGKMQVELYPESVYGYYMIALSEEKKNNLPLALEYYRKGYAKLGDDVGNKADFYADIERVMELMEKK